MPCQHNRFQRRKRSHLIRSEPHLCNPPLRSTPHGQRKRLRHRGGRRDANDWFIVGAGDYDGDGKDDLLVLQYSTGMLGYYSGCDTKKWVEMGRGVDMDWTVIA